MAGACKGILRCGSEWSDDEIASGDYSAIRRSVDSLSRCSPLCPPRLLLLFPASALAAPYCDARETP